MLGQNHTRRGNSAERVQKLIKPLESLDRFTDQIGATSEQPFVCKCSETARVLHNATFQWRSIVTYLFTKASENTMFYDILQSNNYLFLNVDTIFPGAPMTEKKTALSLVPSSL